MEQIYNNFITVMKRFADFQGRATRSEYWYFILAVLIISIVVGIVEGATGGSQGSGSGVLGTLISLIFVVPGLAVSVRRLHDTGRSGWWILIQVIPIIGFIVLLVFTVSDSEVGDNPYGPNPKATPLTV